ncbi:hypothetical protein AHF37_10224 [Paragonimus kellicotti]|nr:hypothetical protein AHF37_10224 [Paragonimus kellicotti]
MQTVTIANDYLPDSWPAVLNCLIKMGASKRRIRWRAVWTKWVNN